MTPADQLSLAASHGADRDCRRVARLMQRETADARAAARLGWYVAGVRGRSWWRGHKPAAAGLPPDQSVPLPLRPERTLAEARRQAFDALVTLAERLDGTRSLASDERPAGRPFADRLAALLVTLDADDAALLRPPSDSGDPPIAVRDRSWRDVAQLMHDWDCAIQDRLAARADILACGYLLGRGLAECYWALAPADERARTDPGVSAAGGWQFRLGDARRTELTRMVVRLAPHLNPPTPAALSGSMQAWGCVAADPGRRSQHAGPVVPYEPLRRWYELLVPGQDPVDPGAAGRRATRLAVGPARLPRGDGHRQGQESGPDVAHAAAAGCLQRPRRHRGHNRPAAPGR